MAIIAPFIPLSKQPRPQARERSDGVSVSCNLAHHIRWFCSPKLRQETSLQLPISRVVSMGRRNTFLKFTRGRLKTQSLSWALI